MSYAKAVLASK